MIRLATFVHVSDLHFGDADPDTGDSLLGSPPAWWTTCRLFDGFLGHHRAALVDFQDAFDILREREGAKLIVTGDLTASADASFRNMSKNQFQIANHYLSSEWTLPGFDSIGLNLAPTAQKTAFQYVVAGNHDHWSGTGSALTSLVIGGGPVPAFNSLFCPAPFVVPPYALGPYLPNVVFLGIDTDASVNQTDLLIARGDVVGQIRRLSSMIKPATNPISEIRILLMHHSFMYQDPSGVLSLNQASLSALPGFLDTYGIAVMLTGHLHVPDENITTCPSGRHVLEVRCGTTTVRDSLPAGWVSPGMNPGDPLPLDTFLVHRLWGDDDSGKVTSIRWRTTLYKRTVGTGGFNVASTPGLLADFQVWP